MTFFAYTHSMKAQFADLLAAYFPEVASDIPEDILRGKLADLIDEQHSQGILGITIAAEGTAAIGFSIYQIDTPESDWCKRPGWGFIREFYIVPEFRKQGFGRRLAYHTEQRLGEMGAARLYLTSDCGPFWTGCGWQDTGEVCSNDLPIFEKPCYQFKKITEGDPLWIPAANYAAGCSWRAGSALCAMMTSGAFADWERVILTLAGGNICGYCAVTKTDCIPDLSYSPYIGYLFVGEAFRGHRLSQQLIEYASQYLRRLGFRRVYLVSDHNGLYEKYGFSVIDRKTAHWGTVEKIYEKEIEGVD